ncbi:RICIN domain-containing protein [Streptomyces sp. IMTB 2501]|uniref:RICIN domain-containing protein n=1 Tax=Streptomyces sp. IMTB 2501 TaxID=1776340 RepID=UPI00117D3713|nr:RICIN domain-containing protein [Streptomyces sp. IMTB 2501]
MAGEGGRQRRMPGIAHGINQRWYRNGSEIRSRMNGKCLDILGGSPAPGQLLVSWSCNGAPSQSWDF